MKKDLTIFNKKKKKKFKKLIKILICSFFFKKFACKSGYGPWSFPFNMGKTNPFVSSQARKVRKHYFNATKEEKHIALSAPLSKDLQTSHGIKRLPVRRDDEVKIVRGQYKAREGRVVAVKLRTMRINIESVTKQKINNENVFIPIHPSNVVITKLKMDKYRKNLIEKKKAGRDKALAKLGRGPQ